FKRSADMRPDETTACLDLVRETSKDDYEQSKSMGGWSDHRKRRELRDKDMRFLLLRRGALRQPSNKSTGIEGFLSFMIDHDSSPRVPVLYIYEIHLKEAMRGQGVGGHTLKVAEGIGAKVGVKKLMLTCLMCNGKARKVYEKFGFALDATSPEEKAMRGRKSKIDHVIMSKNVEGD
ncbi:acyl-CoA N-acyltransferase, partial [Polychaeton citri CBS 116435]